MIYSVDTFPGRTISVRGNSFLYFGGTSYLGLQTDTTFQELFIQNLKKYGTNYGASRKANVQITVFDEAENHLAKLVGSESCITMSSGYLAGQLVAQTLNSSGNEFFYAPESHSALHIPSKKHFSSFRELNKAVRKHLKKSKHIPVILMDSIGISENIYPHFNAIKELPLEKVILVVDDSHGIGIIEKNGSGVYNSIKNLNPKEVLISCSLGKGFGIQAGAILGSKKRMEQFKNSAIYGGASPAAPAALATLIEGATLFKEKQKLLEENIRLFSSSLKNLEAFNYLENYPAFYFSNLEIASFLEKNNILITNFKYPNEDAPVMSRIVLSASHTKEDIKLLAQLLNSL